MRCLQQGRKKHQRCDRKELLRLNIIITFLISMMLLYPIVTDEFPIIIWNWWLKTLIIHLLFVVNSFHRVRLYDEVAIMKQTIS